MLQNVDLTQKHSAGATARTTFEVVLTRYLTLSELQKLELQVPALQTKYSRGTTRIRICNLFLHRRNWTFRGRDGRVGLPACTERYVSREFNAFSLFIYRAGGTSADAAVAAVAAVASLPFQSFLPPCVSVAENVCELSVCQLAMPQPSNCICI